MKDSFVVFKEKIQRRAELLKNHPIVEEPFFVSLPRRKKSLTSKKCATIKLYKLSKITMPTIISFVTDEVEGSITIVATMSDGTTQNYPAAPVAAYQTVVLAPGQNVLVEVQAPAAEASN